MRTSTQSEATSTSDHASRHLDREKILWLGTAGPGGEPSLVPTWFLWDGSAFLLFSKPDARKVRNMRRNPHVMLALGDAEADFDVQLVEGHAELLAPLNDETVPHELVTKYRREMRSIGLSAAEYARTYSQPIRVTPNRFLEWHGRTHLEASRRSAAYRQALRLGMLGSALRRCSGAFTAPPAWVIIGGTAWMPAYGAGTGSERGASPG